MKSYADQEWYLHSTKFVTCTGHGSACVRKRNAVMASNFIKCLLFVNDLEELMN